MWVLFFFFALLRLCFFFLISSTVFMFMIFNKNSCFSFTSRCMLYNSLFAIYKSLESVGFTTWLHSESLFVNQKQLPMSRPLFFQASKRPRDPPHILSPFPFFSFPFLVTHCSQKAITESLLLTQLQSRSFSFHVCDLEFSMPCCAHISVLCDT